MKVTVETRLCPPIMEACGGQKKLQWDLEGTTVSDLLGEMASRYGARMAKALFSKDGKFDPVIQILLNGKEWIPCDRHSHALSDGDAVSFMLLFAGG
jgi:molybdopterin converting factor small subunit